MLVVVAVTESILYRISGHCVCVCDDQPHMTDRSYIYPLAEGEGGTLSCPATTASGKK
jgi:hypothetical protein